MLFQCDRSTGTKGGLHRSNYYIFFYLLESCTMKSAVELLQSTSVFVSLLVYQFFFQVASQLKMLNIFVGINVCLPPPGCELLLMRI